MDYLAVPLDRTQLQAMRNPRFARETFSSKSRHGSSKIHYSSSFADIRSTIHFQEVTRLKEEIQRSEEDSISQLYATSARLRYQRSQEFEGIQTPPLSPCKRHSRCTEVHDRLLDGGGGNLLEMGKKRNARRTPSSNYGRSVSGTYGRSPSGTHGGPPVIDNSGAKKGVVILQGAEGYLPDDDMTAKPEDLKRTSQTEPYQYQSIQKIPRRPGEGFCKMSFTVAEVHKLRKICGDDFVGLWVGLDHEGMQD
ncbi:hypothetical protein RUND412_007691 [Rhizina undulata]